MAHTGRHMALSDASLDEFIAIYAEEYGEQLSREEARIVAMRLLTFVRLISNDPPKDDDSRWQTEFANS